MKRVKFFFYSARGVWRIYRDWILGAAIAWMSVAALVWLGYQFWRLLFQPGFWGAIDLRIYRSIAIGWFNPPVPDDLSRGFLLPPATNAILYPLIGWLDEITARWFWAFVNLLSLGGMMQQLIHASGADSRLGRAFIALVPLAIYATGATIGNGQLGLFVLVLMLYGLEWMQQYTDWRANVGAFLFLTSLVKPTFSAPFGWMVLFVIGKQRFVVWIGAGYVALTVAATTIRNIPLGAALQSWLERGVGVAAEGGTASLSVWLGSLGLISWIVPGAISVFITLGIWVWLHRTSDFWIILGVSALTARLWIYHAWYDDVLLLLPLITLFRIAKRGACDDDVIAGILFAALLLFSIAPGGLYLFPPPFNAIYVAAQVTIWLAVLIFLLWYARKTLSTK